MYEVRRDFRLIGTPSIVSTPAVTYTGPGDVAGAALGWWGFRAFSGATAGTAAIRLALAASPTTQQDFSTLSNGNLDVASIATFLGGDTGHVVTLYDQSGNGLHLSQSTDANRPIYSASLLNSLPGMTTDGSSQTVGHTNGMTASQPYSLSAVARMISTGGNNAIINFSNGSDVEWSGNGTNKWSLFAGAGPFDATATNADAHAGMAILNGASSSQIIDGTTTGGNAGTSALSNCDTWVASFNGSIFLAQMRFFEGGVWSGDKSGTSLLTNQKSYWGTP